MILDNVFSSSLNAVSRAGGFNFVPEGTECRSLRHTFYVQNKFFYFKSGKSRITIYDKDYETIPNRWFFIPAMVPHSYGNDNNQHLSDYWLHFDLYPDGMKIFEGDLPFYVDVPNGTKVDKLFKKLFRSAKSEKTADAFTAKAALMELIGEYIRLAAPEACIKEAHDHDVQKITAYITENIEKNIPIEELARIWHLHPTHFIRAFKKKTGETPGKFVQLRKLAYAKRLLEESEMPINEVMRCVGIEYAPQFTRKFRELYGYTPREYRKLFKLPFQKQKKN